MATLLWVIHINAVEHIYFKWAPMFGPNGIGLADGWFEQEVAAWEGKTVRLKLVQMTLEGSVDDHDGILASLRDADDLLRIAPADRTYEHPSFSAAYRAFNLAQNGQR